MADIDKLKITVDREECIGDGACVNEAPETFELDDENKVVMKEGSTDPREYVVEAARSCPIDIITVVDKETGEQLYPEE